MKQKIIKIKAREPIIKGELYRPKVWSWNADSLFWDSLPSWLLPYLEKEKWVNLFVKYAIFRLGIICLNLTSKGLRKIPLL